MPDASSPQLNQPLRSRSEYLSERVLAGVATAEEVREWKANPGDTFRHHPDMPDPVLREKAAESATWLFHKFWLENQGRK